MARSSDALKSLDPTLSLKTDLHNQEINDENFYTTITAGPSHIPRDKLGIRNDAHA